MPGSPTPPSGRAGRIWVDRRAFLVGAGAGAGWLLARGSGCAARDPRRRRGASYAELLRALAASLTPRPARADRVPGGSSVAPDREHLCVLERPHLGTLALARRSAPSSSSCTSRCSRSGAATPSRGRWPSKAASMAACSRIYGEPETGNAQAVIMGGHLMLRGGGDSSRRRGVRRRHRVRPSDRERQLAGPRAIRSRYHGDAANRFVRDASAPANERRHPPRAAPRAGAPGPARRARTFPASRVGRSPRRRAGGGAPPPRRPSSRATRRSRAARGRSPASRQRRASRRCTSPFYGSHGFYADMRAWAALTPPSARSAAIPTGRSGASRAPAPIVHFKGYSARARLHPGGARPGARERRRVAAASTRRARRRAMRRLLEDALRRATGEAARLPRRRGARPFLPWRDHDRPRLGRSTRIAITSRWRAIAGRAMALRPARATRPRRARRSSRARRLPRGDAPSTSRRRRTNSASRSASSASDAAAARRARRAPARGRSRER